MLEGKKKYPITNNWKLTLNPQHVREAIYDLETHIDHFDATIDKSGVDYSFTCDQEEQISHCYIKVNQNEFCN